MSWSIALVIGVNLVYSGVVIAHIINGRWPLALCFLGYIIANTGLILIEYKNV